MGRGILGGLVAGLLAAATGACGATTVGGAGSPAGGRDNDPARPSGTIVVFAAASLRAPFTALGRRVEAEHPGTTVRFSFAGSSDLVTQLQGGAPGDVLASADTRTMETVAEGQLRPAVGFATNTLEIAVPPDNPAGVRSIRDLARPGTRVVVCAPQVPCGAAAARAEQAAGVDLMPVSEEQSVTDVLGKVSSGEADAGLVYVTDVKAAGARVRGIAFPEAAGVVNTYPIAPLRESANPVLAQVFVDAVLSSSGQAILAAAGFGKAS